jgi:glucose 1-dehydrogenase
MRFSNKTVLVVGGSRGIGLATARRFASEGAKVLIASRSRETGEAAAAALRELGGDVSFAAADAGDAQELRDLFKVAIERLGGIDIHVFSAGISGQPAEFIDVHESEFDRVMQANLRGQFVLGKLVARHMIETKRQGRIVHVSSVGGILAVPSQIGYSVSKAALNMLTKNMAIALAPYGIRVNAVAPGPVMTDMMTELVASPERYEALMARTPLGRLADPEEIAGTIVFMASDDAGYITGQTLYADGGRLPLNYTASKKAPF